MLYKYLPPERVDVLTEQRLRFTPLLSLNDPFEYSVKIGKHIYELAEDVSTDETKFVSLSRNHTNLLMWSHYGASHSGFCIAFRRDHKYFDKAESVRYRRLRFNFNGARDDALKASPAGKSIALEKAVDWAYEEEERLFLNDVPLDAINAGADAWGREILLNKFPLDSVVAVYLGLRASPSLVEKLAQVVLESSLRIKLYMARKSTTQYGLVFKRLKIEIVDE